MSLMRKKENYPAWSSFFNDFFNQDLPTWISRHYSETNTTLPSVNIKESSDRFMVEMAAPGMEKKDFRIEYQQGLLTISSEKKIENETKEGQKFARREFSYQSFSRSFSIPDTADSDKISAKYENGILNVTILKKEKGKQKTMKTIEIR